jgi:hypothetical protein
MPTAAAVRAFDAEHDRLAIDDELLSAVLRRGLDDPGIPPSQS